MARGKEEPRGRLAALQNLFDQAQTLAGGMQRRLAEVGRGVEGQLATLATVIEDNLGDRIDELMSRLSVSLRRDIDLVGERIDTIDRRVAALATDAVQDAVAPVRSLAQSALERSAAAQTRLDELTARLDALERRASDADQAAPIAAGATDELRQQLDRVEQRLTDLGHEVGTRVAEIAALADRLGRIEARLLEQGQEQVARGGELTHVRERLGRLEARLSDLSREQVARAVEAAGLRERVFRLEQRPAGVEPVRPATNGAVAPE